MPNSSKYPRTFNPNLPPNKGWYWWLGEPTPRIFKEPVLQEDEIDSSYAEIDVSRIPQGTKRIEISGDRDSSTGDWTTTITYYGESVEIDNPTFEEDLKKYKVKMQEFEADLAEWQKLKARWDSEVAAETKSHELAELARLKKKYG